MLQMVVFSTFLRMIAAVEMIVIVSLVHLLCIVRPLLDMIILFGHYVCKELKA